MLFRFCSRKLSLLKKIKSSPNTSKEDEECFFQNEIEKKGELDKNIQKNLDSFKKNMNNSSDFKIHSFKFGEKKKFEGALLYIEGLVDNPTLIEAILRPLTTWNISEKEGSNKTELMDEIKYEVLCSADVKKVYTISDMESGFLGGDTLLLLEGCVEGLVINTRGWEKRSVEEPRSESVIRGPREGFCESIRSNTSLIRRKIRNTNLSIEEMCIGEKTQTEICIMYLKGVANPKVINTVKYRLKKLNVDAILESGYIEEYIEDSPFSPFSTIGYSEKPDVVAAKILEGRVAILVDGTPFVLTAPMLFIESFQTAEDYYTRPLYASLVRILRIFAYLITVFGPAVYIALTAFHQELIPTTLLFRIANASEATPFPVFVESLIMIFAFEFLREAGIRLPRPVGQAISIVGALIMGESAVSAGIVGAPMVIVIASTAVASFIVPSQNESGSILRIIMMILGAIAGWYGISMGFLAMLVHLASLNSFGVPYFDSFAYMEDFQDSVVRMPLWTMTKRPRDIALNDIRRGKFFVPPIRPDEKNGEINTKESDNQEENKNKLEGESSNSISGKEDSSGNTENQTLEKQNAENQENQNTEKQESQNIENQENQNTENQENQNTENQENQTNPEKQNAENQTNPENQENQNTENQTNGGENGVLKEQNQNPQHQIEASTLENLDNSVKEENNSLMENSGEEAKTGRKPLNSKSAGLKKLAKNKNTSKVKKLSKNSVSKNRPISQEKNKSKSKLVTGDKKSSKTSLSENLKNGNISAKSIVSTKVVATKVVTTKVVPEKIVPAKSSNLTKRNVAKEKKQ